MKNKTEEKCKKCMGYGFWPIGDLSPMGEIDSRDWGKKVTKCPWCNMGYVKGERYKLLKEIKDKEKKTCYNCGKPAKEGLCNACSKLGMNMDLD